MKKQTLFLVITLLLASLQGFACDCIPSSLTQKFQKADFIAIVKLVKIRPDKSDLSYHDAEIKLIKLYKGDRINAIKIHSLVETSCGFLPTENSTWLIFAYKWEGKLSFDYCSGSSQLDIIEDEGEYPKSTGGFKRHNSLQIESLDFLKRHKIANLNPQNLAIVPPELESIKGYKNRNRFAVFQVNVDVSKTVTNVTTLRKFQNEELNKLITDKFKTELKFGNSLPLTKPAQLFIFCYFYEKEKRYPSFLGYSDL
ncbi:MAG: hypothetical protein V4687_16525 [Bacteroidota bacterium]